MIHFKQRNSYIHEDGFFKIKRYKTFFAAGIFAALLLGVAGCDPKAETTGKEGASIETGALATEASAAETELQSQPDTATGQQSQPDTATELQSQPDTAAGQQSQPDTAAGVVSGVFHLDLLADKSLESYDSAKVNEIIMEPEGSSFVFWTEQTLKDLKLIGVDYDGDQFMEREIFCSYSEFTPEDALLITHFFSEEMADLKLTFYDDQGQLQSLYITQDGQNAAPVMMSESDLLF